MSVRSAIYALASGAIEKVVTCPQARVALQLGAGQGALAAPNGELDNTHYVDVTASELKARSSLSEVLSTSPGAASLTGLPNPCQLTVLGQTHEITDGIADLSFDSPGKYTIKLSSEPRYFPKTLDLDVP